MRLVRVLVIALAVLICAGFLLGIRQARSSNELTALVATGHPLTPAEQRSAASDLSSASFGYPGQEVQILAGSLALKERRFAHAMSIARSVNRAEPDNLQGWILLAAVGIRTHDRGATADARRELIRLDPIDVPPG